MPTIVRRPTRSGTRYKAVIRLKDYPTQTATFRRKSDAVRWAQQTEAAMRQGRHFSSRSSRSKSVRNLLERYSREIVPSRTPRDHKMLRSRLEWWARHLGDYSLAGVTPAIIAETRDLLGTDEAPGGRPASPATQNRYLQVLSHAFTVGIREWEWLEHNPVRRVRKLREPRGRVRFLSDEERTRLLESCRQSRNSLLYPLVLLALSTGARCGELLSLRWSDVDLENGSAVLHHTKNGERRALSLTGPALDWLHHLAVQAARSDDLVFAKTHGKATFPRNAWLAAVRRAEISDFRFHDLRHSAASYLAMSQATTSEIATILGHKTLNMVKRYAHLSEQHTSSVVARMTERYLAGSPRPEQD